MIPRVNGDRRWRAHDPVIRESGRPKWGPLVGRDFDGRGVRLRYGRIFAHALPTTSTSGKADDARKHNREISRHCFVFP